MKKSSLKTTTKVDATNHGSAQRRVERTKPAEGGKPYDGSEFKLNGDTNQGIGTKNNRYARSKPGVLQPTGLAQPLKTNSPMKNDIDAIGSGVLTSSTPLRKRKG